MAKVDLHCYEVVKRKNVGVVIEHSVVRGMKIGSYYHRNRGHGTAFFGIYEYIFAEDVENKRAFGYNRDLIVMTERDDEAARKELKRQALAGAEKARRAMEKLEACAESLSDCDLCEKSTDNQMEGRVDIGILTEDIL